jgi:hypothetical protein
MKTEYFGSGCSVIREPVPAHGLCVIASLAHRPEGSSRLPGRALGKRCGRNHQLVAGGKAIAGEDGPGRPVEAEGSLT